jgi:hypothetical protein
LVHNNCMAVAPDGYSASNFAGVCYIVVTSFLDH